MKILAVAMLSTFAVGILATGPAPHTSPTPATSSAPLSKFQRERLEKFKNSAPADEYFGRMKMSFLGINNTFRDATIASGDHTLEPAIVNKVALANDALEDWARRFPRDPQLPRSYFLAIQSEKRIWLQPNQDRAWVYMNRIVQIFPATFFGKTVKKEMDLGFTEHYYAEAVPCSTPTPMATPTAQPLVTPTEEPRRGARATPTPTPTAMPSSTPTPSATPSASPRALARNLKVQILTPLCVPPPTATPIPAATQAPATMPSPAFAPQATSIPQPQPLSAPQPTGTPAPAGTPAAMPSPQTTASPKARTRG